MVEQLPPFAALRAFHAAAVHGRFRDAAERLGVTESAIRHQVRRLEDFLHVDLFQRSDRHLEQHGAARCVRSAGAEEQEGALPPLAGVAVCLVG